MYTVRLLCKLANNIHCLWSLISEDVISCNTIPCCIPTSSSAVMFSAKPKIIPMTIKMKIRLSINFCMHCSPHVLTCMLLLCCFSLKAFVTLVREIMKKNRHHSAMNVFIPIPLDTDVKTTEVHAIHQYYITCTEISM